MTEDFATYEMALKPYPRGEVDPYSRWLKIPRPRDRVVNPLDKSERYARFVSFIIGVAEFQLIFTTETSPFSPHSNEHLREPGPIITESECTIGVQ